MLNVHLALSGERLGSSWEKAVTLTTIFISNCHSLDTSFVYLCRTDAILIYLFLSGNFRLFSLPLGVLFWHFFVLLQTRYLIFQVLSVYVDSWVFGCVFSCAPYLRASAFVCVCAVFRGDRWRSSPTTEPIKTQQCIWQAIGTRNTIGSLKGEARRKGPSGPLPFRKPRYGLRRRSMKFQEQINQLSSISV